MKDFITYIDTDSLYICMGKWLEHMGIDMINFEKLDIQKRIKYIQEIAKEVENYININSFEKTQKVHHNSQVDDFKINFEQEKIALSGLFCKKKKYATWTLLDGGKWKDSMSVTGLEIIRSDSPEIVKPKIKHILELILKRKPDEEIKSLYTQYKKELFLATPEEIAENKGINKLDKYVSGYECKKGTPHQLRGVANFKFLIDKLNIIADIPQAGEKSKVVYLQKNKYKKFSASFKKWPKEFDQNNIKVDYTKMIENNFIKKIKLFLTILKKEHIISKHQNITDFFN